MLEISDLQALTALEGIAGNLGNLGALNILFRCMILDGEPPAILSRYMRSRKLTQVSSQTINISCAE